MRYLNGFCTHNFETGQNNSVSANKNSFCAKIPALYFNKKAEISKKAEIQFYINQIYSCLDYLKN